VAFTEVISGRAPEKRGNGLKVVRRIAEAEKMSLQLRSGLGVAKIPKHSGFFKIDTATENVRGVYAVVTF
jgi:hypothetical protein